MPNSDKDSSAVSLESLYCDVVATGEFPAIPRKYALTVTRSCEDCYKQGVLSCKHPQRHEYFEEGKGFDLRTKSVRGVVEPLPFYIPVPIRDALKLPLFLPHKVMGVRLSDVFPNATYTSHGLLRFSASSTPNLNLTTAPVYSNSKPLLFYSGTDVLIEGINREKESYKLYEVLETLGITMSTTPDFSVNEGSCSYGQLVNTNRTLAIGEEMNAHGIAVMPNVFAINPYLLELWVDSLNNSASVQTIAINCQLQKDSKYDMEVLLWYICELLKNVSHHLHVVLHGFPITKKEYLLRLKPFACQIHFAESAAFSYAFCKFRYQLYDPFTQSLYEVVGANKLPVTRAQMIKTTILSREQYLLDVFYADGVCRPFVIREFATLQ